MSLISINIRGLGGGIEWNYLGSIVRKENPGVVCCQETKLVNVNYQQCYSLWGSNSISWVHRSVDMEGGGILTLWNQNVFLCDRTLEGKGYMVIEGKYKIGRGDSVVRVGIINVYSTGSNIDKAVLWENLGRILRSNDNIAWCDWGF